MVYVKPGVKMPRLPRIIGTGSNDAPPIVGLDNQSSYRPRYNPATGLSDSDLILLENGAYLLTEDELKILIH